MHYVLDLLVYLTTTKREEFFNIPIPFYYYFIGSTTYQFFIPEKEIAY